tara:strand:- start:423 stop:1136 length:714 start_codon:yes stop_codon:yes gene_type:complete
MNAILLAGGFGSRLRPFTNHVPKCLAPIGGKPLLGYWLDSLMDAGIESVLINLHYLANQVNEFVSSSPYCNRITLVNEHVLLGTAGTVKQNSEFFSEERGLVIHADNFCTANLAAFIDKHENRPLGTELTMMTFVADEPRTCGILEADEKGIVHGFHEKVENPPGNVANAAIYIFEPSVIQFISSSPPGELVDISKDVIPEFLGRIFATPADGLVIDIGTPSSLKRAQSYALSLEGL